MDSVKQNKEGYAPIQADLEAIAAIQDRKEIIAQMAKLGSKGLPGYSASTLMPTSRTVA